MWILYVVSTLLFLAPMFTILVYSACLYVFIAAPLRFFSKCFEKKEKRHLVDSQGVTRYRGWGWKVGIYARNIALSIPDQGIATFTGQGPDISISEALGIAAIIHDNGDGYVHPFVIWFGKFVDWLFWNPFWKIEENHIRNSLDPGEKFYNTLSHWHMIDSQTNSRDVAKYIENYRRENAS